MVVQKYKDKFNMIGILYQEDEKETKGFIESAWYQWTGKVRYVPGTMLQLIS